MKFNRNLVLLLVVATSLNFVGCNTKTKNEKVEDNNIKTATSIENKETLQSQDNSETSLKAEEPKKEDAGTIENNNSTNSDEKTKTNNNVTSNTSTTTEKQSSTNSKTSTTTPNSKPTSNNSGSTSTGNSNSGSVTVPTQPPTQPTTPPATTPTEPTTPPSSGGSSDSPVYVVDIILGSYNDYEYKLTAEQSKAIPQGENTTYENAFANYLVSNYGKTYDSSLNSLAKLSYSDDSALKNNYSQYSAKYSALKTEVFGGPFYYHPDIPLSKLIADHVKVIGVSDYKTIGVYAKYTKDSNGVFTVSGCIVYANPR